MLAAKNLLFLHELLFYKKFYKKNSFILNVKLFKIFHF